MNGDWHVTLISILGGGLIALIGLVWRNLNAHVEKKVNMTSHDDLEKKVNGKLDTELYQETMVHIKKAVDGINGTAQTLKVLANDIITINRENITRKEFDYELRLHRSECPAIREISKLINEGRKE